MTTVEPTPERPVYTMIRQQGASNMYMIRCDEGWRQSIVCEGMHEWAARWLIGLIQFKPYAEERP